MQPFSHTFKTSFGWCALVFDRDTALVSEILLPRPRQTLTEMLASTVQATLPLPKPLQRLAADLRRYFDRPPHPLAVPWDLLDLGDLTELQRRVLETTAAIPFGQTRSYGDIARAVDSPRAARFVGNTMARNPFPIVIPCHRVVRADGTPGHFGGGPELKRRMLQLEKTGNR